MGGRGFQLSLADLTDSLGIEGIETKNFGTLINLIHTYIYICVISIDSPAFSELKTCSYDAL